MKFIIQIRDIALRELQILRKNNLYAFCMVVFPLLTGLFFTSLLSDGVPLDLPIGVVDLDNSSTSRSLVRRCFPELEGGGSLSVGDGCSYRHSGK